jgi:hypothetical protein
MFKPTKDIMVTGQVIFPKKKKASIKKSTDTGTLG